MFNDIKDEIHAYMADMPKDEREDWLHDVVEYGCSSGVAGDMIYYSDTCAFYERHRETIGKWLANYYMMSPEDLFGKLWDSADPLANDTPNQNLLAWAIYEDACRELLADI